MTTNEILKLPLLNSDWKEGSNVGTLINELVYQTIKEEGCVNFDNLHYDLGEVFIKYDLITYECGETGYDFKIIDVANFLKEKVLNKIL